MNEDDFRLLGDVVAGVAQHVDRLVQAARRDEDEVAIERRSNPDRQLAGSQRRDDGAQHPVRLGIVRLVTIPQRGPCVVRCVVAPYRRTSVRTEYERMQFGFSGDLGSVGRALEGEPALEHPQFLRTINCALSETVAIPPLSVDIRPKVRGRQRSKPPKPVEADAIPSRVLWG